MGQYIQDGMRIIFETVLGVENPKYDISLKEDAENIDGLNFLAGRTVNYVNKTAMREQCWPYRRRCQFILSIPGLDEFSFGSLVYF